MVSHPNPRTAVILDRNDISTVAWKVAIPDKILVFIAICLRGCLIRPQDVAAIRSIGIVFDFPYDLVLKYYCSQRCLWIP